MKPDGFYVSYGLFAVEKWVVYATSCQDDFYDHAKKSTSICSH